MPSSREQAPDTARKVGIYTPRPRASQSRVFSASAANGSLVLRLTREGIGASQNIPALFSQPFGLVVKRVAGRLENIGDRIISCPKISSLSREATIWSNGKEIRNSSTSFSTPYPNG